MQASVVVHFQKGLAGARNEAIAAAQDTAVNLLVLDVFARAIIGSEAPPAYLVFAGYAPDVVAGARDAEKRVRHRPQCRDDSIWVSCCLIWWRDHFSPVPVLPMPALDAAASDRAASSALDIRSIPGCLTAILVELEPDHLLARPETRSGSVRAGSSPTLCRAIRVMLADCWCDGVFTPAVPGA
jgi:hypothetical protein